MPAPRPTGEDSVLVIGAGSATTALGEVEEVLEFDIGNAPPRVASYTLWGFGGGKEGESNIGISSA